ncbi:MAG: hypothetical protein ACERKD_04870 [Prolixibacteraceae bacterium]
MKLNFKRKFIIQNAARAIFALAILAFAFFLFDQLIFKENPEFWIQKFYSNPGIIYLIYVGSEVFFGIFPPEIFMVWALNKGSLYGYIGNLAFFAIVSYGAGYLSFFAGRYFSKVLYFRFLQRKFFVKYLPKVRRFGTTLIIIAALTPVPWATISLLIGTTNYSMRRYLLFALSRILRFIIYGFIIYKTHVFFK